MHFSIKSYSFHYTWRKNFRPVYGISANVSSSGISAASVIVIPVQKVKTLGSGGSDHTSPLIWLSDWLVISVCEHYVVSSAFGCMTHPKWIVKIIIWNYTSTCKISLIYIYIYIYIYIFIYLFMWVHTVHLYKSVLIGSK